MRLADLSEKRIALAVSGGSDSMAMLRLALQQYADKVITALTVDHGLRAASAAEALQVSSWCSQLGVSHKILEWIGPKPKTGIQANAREARYDLMTQWCLQNNVPVLLTAHTADDQTETIVMRQERTKSLKSLAGIWPSRDWKGVRIFRPVLEIHKQELQNYLQSIGQDWIEDPSNKDEGFERVRIRKQLANSHMDLSQTARVAQNLVSHSQIAAQEWVQQNLNIHPYGFVMFDRIPFSSAAPEVQDFILLKILKVCGSGHLVELKERLAVLEWLKLPAASRRVLGGALFMKRSGSIIVGREVGRIDAQPQIIPESGKLVWDERFLVHGPAGAQVVAGAYGPKRTRNKEYPAFILDGLPVLMMNGESLPFQQKLEFLRY